MSLPLSLVHIANFDDNAVVSNCAAEDDSIVVVVVVVDDADAEEMDGDPPAMPLRPWSATIWQDCVSQVVQSTDWLPSLAVVIYEGSC